MPEAFVPTTEDIDAFVPTKLEEEAFVPKVAELDAFVPEVAEEVAFVPEVDDTVAFVPEGTEEDGDTLDVSERPYPLKDAKTEGVIVNLMSTMEVVDRPRAAIVSGVIEAIEQDNFDAVAIKKEMGVGITGEDHPMLGEYLQAKAEQIRNNPDDYPITSPILNVLDTVLDLPYEGYKIWANDLDKQNFKMGSLIALATCGSDKECQKKRLEEVVPVMAGIANQSINQREDGTFTTGVAFGVGFMGDVLLDPVTYTNPILKYTKVGLRAFIPNSVMTKIIETTGNTKKQIKESFLSTNTGQSLAEASDFMWALFSTKHDLKKLGVEGSKAYDLASKFKNLIAAARVKAVRDNTALQQRIQQFSSDTGVEVDDINKFITEAVERGGIPNVDARHLSDDTIRTLAENDDIRYEIWSLAQKNKEQLAAEIKAGVKLTPMREQPLVTADGDTTLYLQYMNHAIKPEALKASKKIEIKESGGRSLSTFFNSKHSSTFKRREDWLGLTINDINAAAKKGELPGYEGQVFKDGFFYDDPSILQALRDNKHYRSLAATELAGAVIGPQGFGVSPDELIKLAKDAGWTASTTKKKLTSNEALKYLQEHNPKEWLDWEVTSNKYTADWVLPKDIAKFVDNNLTNLNDPKKVNMFLNQYDDLTRWWKSWTLSIFPSYHIRNAVGNTWNNYVSGVELKTYKEALTVQQGIAKNEAGHILIGGEKVSYNQIRDWVDDYGVTGRGLFTSDIETSLKHEMGEGKWLTLSSKNKAIEIGKKVGEAVEDNARFANFIDGLRKGLSPEDSAKRVRKTLFDYSDLTDFEQGVMKRIFPFYTWTRKNVPFQLEQMVKHPGKYKAIDTLRQEVEAATAESDDDEKYISEWMLANYPTKVGVNDNGEAQYFLLGGWWAGADLWKLGSQPTKLVTDLLHPVLKVGLEMFTATTDEKGYVTDLFSGQKLHSELQTDYLFGTTSETTKHYLNNLRVLSTLDEFVRAYYNEKGEGPKKISPFVKEPKTIEEALASFFTGVRIFSTDLENQKLFWMKGKEKESQLYKELVGKSFKKGRPIEEIEKLIEKSVDPIKELPTFRRGGLVAQTERLGFSKGGELSLGEQQRLVDYSNTEDSLLPVTEGTPEPTMSEGISSDWNKRLESMDESRRDRESGEISLARSTVNTAGALAGGAFDTGGRLIEESVDTYLDNLKSFAPTTYNKVADKVTETKEWALNTDAGKAAVEAAQAGYEKYSVWKEANPQDAKTFESVLNIGMFGWGAKGVSSQVNKLFDKPTVNTVDNIVPEKPVLPPVATKKKAPVRDKGAEDTELTTLAEGLTESGGFKYKLPTMLLDLTVKDKVGDSKPSQWKYNINRWVKKGKIKKEELDDSRLMGWLDTQAADTKIATKDIFSFMKENSPLLKTYTSKIGNRRDDEWYNSQPLIQERVAVEGDYHNKLQEVAHLQDKDNIGDVTADNKELVLKAAGWLHFTSVENIITGDYNTQIDSDFKKFFAKSAYADKAIEREITQAKFIDNVDSVFHPDQPEFNSAQHRDEMINTILGTGNPQRRNSHILGAIIEDVNQAYLKAEGSERELLNNYVDTFVEAGKAKAEYARFTYDNKTELRELSTEALRRNAGDVSPNTWNNYALPNTRGKPVTILVQSKVGSEDRLKKLREFHKSVEDARTGTMLGEGIPALQHRVKKIEQDRDDNPIAARIFSTKQLMTERRALKKQLADFKKKTGVAWEDRDTYINKAETELYLEPHYTGIYGESPLKKDIPQENLILHIRGNVVEQSSFGEGKGLFINEQQSQAHQAAMGNARHFENLTEIAPGLRGISGYAKLDAGPKAAKLIEKKRSIQKAIDKLWGNIDVPANIALEHPDVKRISKIVTPMDEEIADIEMELRHLTGLPSNERMNLISDESIPENLSHKKDWTPLAMKQSIKYAVDNDLNYIVLPIERHSISQIEQWGDKEPGVMQAIIDRNSIYSPRAYRSIVKKWDKDAKPFEDEYLDSDERGDWTEADIHKVVVFPITKAIREGIKKDGLTAYRRGGLVTQMKALIPND